METTKYRLIFLPDADYLELKTSLDKKKLQTYLALDEKGVDNFSLGDSLVVYVPDTHRKFLTKKAEKGEAL